MTVEPKGRSSEYTRAMIDPPSGTAFPYKHLIAIEGMDPTAIQHILDLAETYADQNHKLNKKNPLLEGLTQINLFFENSTRTLMSFEIAGKRLGMDTVNLSTSTSSIKKGETLLDTALTLNAMRPDVIVVRHNSSGAVGLLAEKMDCPVINAGDGCHEHPTQALLDALTIRRRKGQIHDLTIAICGDITHSRVARSNIHLLNAMGARVRIVGPTTLIPKGIEAMGVDVSHSMEKGLEDVDVVMMLRLQQERMNAGYLPSLEEYFHLFGLTEAKLLNAKPDALILHPGPMNRGVEIATGVADDIDRSAIQEQVEMGVAVRMAALDLLTRPLRLKGEGA
jgi:aspartate carbamoyltransferase catalytic subunit